MRAMSEDRDRDPPERETSQPAAPSEEYKIFVGGISWHMDDRELKDSEFCFLRPPSISKFGDS